MEPPSRAVAVFGASWAQDGDALYTESVSLGAALSASGFDVVTGGYGGTMEGVSRGASEARAESLREGVLCSSLFPYRPLQGAVGNAYLTHTTDECDLLSRIRTMTKRTRIFVVMRGTLGTLTELCCVWNMAALARAAGQEPLLVLVYRQPWEAALNALGAALAIPSAHADTLKWVDCAADVVREAVAFEAPTAVVGAQAGAGAL